MAPTQYSTLQQTDIGSIYTSYNSFIDRWYTLSTSGGSGCGCIGTIFSGYFYKQLKEKKLKRILLIATGALMNSTSTQQGESIPGIAHAISVEI